MPSRNELIRARARLQLEAPISDDADLLKLQEQAVEYVRKAKRSDPKEPGELAFTVVDTVARFYFAHVIRKQRRASTAISNDAVRIP